jgi:hypothetical protein
MRFVSAHLRVETECRRWLCQLKTSRQASQQLRRHFVVVNAFAFACPRVPNRIGAFDVPIFVHRERSKTAVVSLTRKEHLGASHNDREQALSSWISNSA